MLIKGHYKIRKHLWKSFQHRFYKTYHQFNVVVSSNFNHSWLWRCLSYNIFRKILWIIISNFWCWTIRNTYRNFSIGFC